MLLTFAGAVNRLIHARLLPRPPTTVSRDLFLVDTAWLAGHLADAGLRIVDIRGTIRPPDAPRPWYLPRRDAYLEAHIPGAVFIDWTADIVEVDAPVAGTLAGPARFQAAMARAGIGDDTDVVVYDDSGSIAPRLWWALRYYGHARVRLLDGGFGKWIAEGRPTEAGERVPPPARFTPRVEPGWRAGAADVRAALADPGTALVDCRSAREFMGEVGRGEKKGRIPGACLVPAVQLLEGEHRTWKDPSAIRAAYKKAGVAPGRRVITYCNSGVSASVALFALKLSGYGEVANYAGSWYDWERDPGNPVATGA